MTFNRTREDSQPKPIPGSYPLTGACQLTGRLLQSHHEQMSGIKQEMAGAVRLISEKESRMSCIMSSMEKMEILLLRTVERVTEIERTQERILSKQADITFTLKTSCDALMDQLSLFSKKLAKATHDTRSP